MSTPSSTNASRIRRSSGVGVLTVLCSLAVLVIEVGVIAAIGVGLSGILAKPLFSVAVTYLTVAALVLGPALAATVPLLV